jgi:plastocyanin
MRSRCAPILLLLLVVAGCGSSPGGPPSSEAQVTRAEEQAAPSTTRAEAAQVVIDNFAFTPRTLTVTRGTRVTWVNHDDVPHTVTSSARPRTLESGPLDTDDTFAFVFTTPGTFDYFCAVHPHMTGQVIVK